MKSSLSNPCLMTLATGQLSSEFKSPANRENPEVVNSSVMEMCPIPPHHHHHCNGTGSRCDFLWVVTTVTGSGIFHKHLPCWTSMDLSWGWALCLSSWVESRGCCLVWSEKQISDLSDVLWLWSNEWQKVFKMGTDIYKAPKYWLYQRQALPVIRTIL